ncbi:disulfide bond formation protein B [Nocardia goodfellowii]
MSAPERKPMTGDPIVNGKRVMTMRPNDRVLSPWPALDRIAEHDVPEQNLRRKIGVAFAHIYILGVCAILAGAFYYQFVRWEYPCPLCLLQRILFLLSAIGPGYVIARSRAGALSTRDWATGWGWTVVASICGAVVAAAQVLMHIVPPDPGYAGTLFGLHLYTWALIGFVCAVLAAGLMLFLTPSLGATTYPVRRRDTAVFTLGLLALFALANLIACFFLQGLHWQLPDMPDGYVYFSDQH